MPVSDRKLNANRTNAQKATGPKTRAGKTASSRNAVKHGLYSHDLIIRSPHLQENLTEYKNLHASVIEELNPTTALQEIFARKITDCLWRSRRVAVAETAHITHQLDDADWCMKSESDLTAYLDRTAKRTRPDSSRRTRQRERSARFAQSLVPDCRYTHDLQRYEMRLDRQLTRLYHMYSLLKQNPARELESNPAEPPECSLDKNEKTNPPQDASQQHSSEPALISDRSETTSEPS